MFNNYKYIDALSFFKENHDLSFSKYLENDDSIKFISQLIDSKCQVQVELELYDNQEIFNCVLLVLLPEHISNKLLILLVEAKPNKISEIKPDVLRLWWD